MTSPIRILHVDDEPDFADMTATFLERADDRFAVATATSAAEGLDRLTEDVHCVVSDYEMPGMNGIELIAAVRESYPDLPFVLFTGKGSEAVASEAISAGVTDYVQKQPGSEQYELLANRIRTAVGQYRAEAELDRQNDLFAQTQDLAEVGAWEYIVADQDVHFTEKVYDIYGVDPDYEPTPGQDIERFYHPEDRDTVRAAIEAAWEAGEPYDIEVRIAAADGTEKWVRTLGEPTFEDGQCERVRGTIRDITERKEREQALEEANEWYRTLLDGAPDAVFVADAESGEIRETNRAATRLLGLSREDIVGRHQTDLHPPEKAEEYASLFEDHVAAGGGRDETLENRADIYVVDANGERIPVEIHAQAVEIDGESFNQGYFRDITERKRRERELERQNERLDEFASVVSHDLRNPLQVLSASLELLETDDEAALERCQRAAARMDELVDDLFTLARHGETDTSGEPVGLDAAATASAETTLPPDVPLSIETSATVVAAAGRLKQLFENLFSNAVEHGSTNPRSHAHEDAVEHGSTSPGPQARQDAVEHGGRDVTITVGDIDGGFYVEDDGTGIPETAREAVFEPGYSTSDDGTGFGLSIVTDVAETHGWDVRVTESDAGGARFEITGVEFATR